MVSFGADLDAVRPRKPLRLFDWLPGETGLLLMSRMIKQYYIDEMRETLERGRVLLYGDPQPEQLRLFP